MKLLIKTLLALSLLFFSVEILLAKKIDNSRIKMLNGEYAKLSDFHSDGPLIINFWTTWWPFCERQLAYLDQLNSNFKDAGLSVLAVNVNKPNILKQVRPYINKRKYKFPVSVDPRSKLAKKLGVIGYPALYLVDKDGTILYKSSGYEEGKEDEYLEKLTDYFNGEGIVYQKFEYEKSKIVETKEGRVIIDF